MMSGFLLIFSTCSICLCSPRRTLIPVPRGFLRVWVWPSGWKHYYLQSQRPILAAFAVSWGRWEG